jgi:hypothetical protein
VKPPTCELRHLSLTISSAFTSGCKEGMLQIAWPMRAGGGNITARITASVLNLPGLSPLGDRR